jgi:hypothetical protein
MERNRHFLFTVGIILTINLGLAIDSSTTWALDSSLYELTDESSYLEGCYDPCDCLLMLYPTLQGSFLLTSVSQGEDVSLFEVMEVDWQFIQEDETILVTGSGLYQIDSGQHRLTLDLLVGNAPVRQFDSGLVPLQSEFPGISIAIALNSFYCYDNVFDISALPAPVELSNSSWGSLKSIFR